MNSREKARERALVMLHFADGGEIEFKEKIAGQWFGNGGPKFNWETFDYRIKPEQTGSDKVREMLSQGKPVLCCLSDVDQEAADTGADKLNRVAVVTHVNTNNEFVNTLQRKWKHASPIDPAQFATMGDM